MKTQDMDGLIKKILFIVKLPPPVTGATLMNKSIYYGIAKLGKYETTLISANYAESVADLGRYSINKIGTYFRVLSDLIGNIIKNKPDLIYFQISPTGLPFMRDSILTLIIKIFRIEIIYHLHGLGIEESITKHKIINAYYRIIFKGTNVICLSDSLTYDTEKLKVKRTYVVNNGIPEITYDRPRFVSGNRINILFLSNMIRSKGLLLYVETIKLLQRKNIYDFMSYVVGEEGDISKEALLKIIDDENLRDNMVYLGAKYAEEKADILRKADILIYPSLKDAFPCTVLEALQAGTACITSNVGALSDIIDDGETGIVIENIDPKTILEKLESLINNKKVRKSMAKEGRKKYEEQYTLSRVVTRIQFVFDDILKKQIG
jgi:glycosyltransferase involved in cell wall biosynthesis